MLNNKDKKCFEAPISEIIMFSTEDVVTTSTLVVMEEGRGDEYEW